MQQDWTTIVLNKPVKLPETTKPKPKEDVPLMEVTVELKVAMQQARLAKGLSQKDLANKMCVPAQVIHSYENGKAIPNNAFIARMETFLGTRLPRIKKKMEKKSEKDI
jgi:putative transcription factor